MSTSLLLEEIPQPVFSLGHCESMKYCYKKFPLTLLTSFLLVRHPKVLAKLQKEVALLGDASELNRTELRNMKYLQNVLKESEFSWAKFK